MKKRFMRYDKKKLKVLRKCLSNKLYVDTYA